MKKQRDSKYYFYILKCKDNTLYSGITVNLKRRLAMHNSGTGSAYVRSRGGGKIIYSEACKNLSSALRREAQVKKLTRLEKLAMIKIAKIKPA